MPEVQSYLSNYVIPIPADFPGQLYIRRAIVNKMKLGINSPIPEYILHMVPILGPLHVSLNTQETCFLLFHPFFNQLYKEVFGKKRNLAEKPKPWRINLLLYLAYMGWNLVKDHIFSRFNQSKNIGYQTFVDLLDNLIPATLDIYANLFRGNRFEEYLETIFRLWTVMRRSQRKNYDKLMLAFISDVQYWRWCHHSMINLLKTELRILDEYPVENFHSLVRRHTSSKVNTPDWLRRDAIFIDHCRHENDFARSFSAVKSYPYTKKNLDTMSKQSAIFLLDFFGKLWVDKEKWEVKTEGKKIKKQVYYFPPLTKGLSKGALPSGYHTLNPPNQDIFCDWNQCTLNASYTNGKVLICGHAYHDQCFENMGSKCCFCFEYFCAGIDELSKSYNERLEMNMNLEENFEEPAQKNEENVSLDEADEFQSINTLDDGLTKAILGIS